jgi:hypothetical protein
MAQRSQEAIPTVAFDGQPFSLALGNGEAIAGPDVWAMRFDTADEDLRDEQGVERRWRTEAALVSLNGQSHFALRLSVVTATAGLPFFRSAPTLIRELTKDPGISFDGFAPSRNHTVSGQQLISFLAKQDRRPVLAISELESGETIVDIEVLAKALIGFAHVVRVPADLSRYLTKAIGWKWSIHGGAARLYLPGLDPDTQDVRSHTLWTPKTIGQEINEHRRWQRRVLDRVLALSIARPDLDDVAPSFVVLDAYLKARQQKEAAKAARQAEKMVVMATTADEELHALRNELAAVRHERDSVTDELGALNAKLDEISQDRDLAYEVNGENTEEIERLRSQIFSLNAKTRHLEERLKHSGEPSEIIEIPDSYDELRDWAERYFPDRLIVLTKALRTAKKALYGDISRVYACLKLLASEYVDMRRGVDGAGEQFSRACEALRVEVSGVGSALDDRRYREQFTVPYKSGSAEMDLHLCPAPGTAERCSVDPKKTFRIYFFWDSEDEVVVVGSLPAHLTTKLTT